MAKLPLPKHIVISLSRVLTVIGVLSVAAGGAQLSAQAPHTDTLQPQRTARHAISAPVAQAPAPPVTTPTPASSAVKTPPVPKPVSIAQVPHSATAAPVVTPSNGASVNGLAPVDPTPAPQSTSDPSTPNTTQDNTPPSTPAQTPPQQTTSYMSTNWSGYMATTGHYTSIAGSWVVPSASGTPGKTSADTAWVGVGGVSSDDLIQAGTFDTVDSSGHEAVQAFYEMLPAAAKFDTNLAVAASDSISVSITETSTNNWRITITDVTTGKSFTKNTTYASSYSSAEWIEEDPSQLNGSSISLMPLDIFSPVQFTGGSAIDSGATESIAGTNALPITLVSGSRHNPHVLALPSAIAGSSFTVTRTQ